jgi:hypothetical protein
LGLALLAATACGGRVYVRLAPPPGRVEVISLRPGELFVWVDGFWAWGESVYVWTPGRWVQVPRPGTVWIPGAWRESHRGYYWTPGHWR